MHMSLAMGWTTPNDTATCRIFASLRTPNTAYVHIPFGGPRLGAAAMIKPVTSSPAQLTAAPQVEPFLLEVADLVHTTRRPGTTLRGVGGRGHKINHAESFALPLVNEKSQY